MRNLALVALGLFLAAVALPTTARAGTDDPFSFKFRIGAQAFVKAELDGEPIAGEDDIHFGVQRGSVFATGSIYDFAELKVHLLAKIDKSLAANFVDAHLKFKIHPLFNVKIGRFKKPLTRVYTPTWSLWRFFDVPTAFSYIQKGMGLGGRGEGMVLYGAWQKRILKYSVGVFNGLEEVSSSDTFMRTDEGLELMARIDWQPLEMFQMGIGVAYAYDTIQNTRALATDPWTAQKMALLAFNADVNVYWRGLTVSAEYIGHSTLPDQGDGVMGGGFYADVLYGIPIPIGEIEPGLRYGRHYNDFDDTDTYTEHITGALQWHVLRPGLRVGLEVTWMNSATAAADTDSLLGLVQVQFIR